ncbi:MAG: dihydropteroate synthase [Candidatus Melainabacteria bacterium]|nr:dihydropteroate synthase [Candidatus Melainabacteria bacterium]
MLQGFKQSVKVSDFVNKPIVMGILNVTPDSFSDGGKYVQIEDAVKHVEKLIKAKVDIIDVGGESTRPGATLISEEEELKRVIPIIYELKKRFPDIFISIDTYKSNVAQLALGAGVKMINDVSGLTMDPDMVKVAAKANCPIVIMHNKGIPATKPDKSNAGIIQEVYNWLQKQSQYAIDNGIKKENIIIDVGIGFGKTAKEDLYLIENSKEFKSLGFPVLVGPSKKSFIKKLFPQENIEQKSKEMAELAVKNGADIVRVHQL